MKFAKELDRDAVPEWRAKYLNYKAGKKHIKAVSRAINRALGTPTLTRRSEAPRHTYTTPASFFGIGHSFTPTRQANDPLAGGVPEGAGSGRSGPGVARQQPKPQPGPENERSGLARSPGSSIQYGSFDPQPSRASDRNEFELPAPAIRIPSRTSDHLAPPTPQLKNRPATQRSGSAAAATPRLSGTGLRSPSSFNLQLPVAGSSATTPRQRVARLFSTGSPLVRQTSNKRDIAMQNLDHVRAAERDFYAFLDSELDKIETFYKQKEDQASERLAALRAQLHEMRNRRTAEIAAAKQAKTKRELRGNNNNRSHSHSEDGVDGNMTQRGGTGSGSGSGSSSRDWISPIKVKFLKPGPNSKALQRMAATPVMAAGRTTPGGTTMGMGMDGGRDYMRRPQDNDDVSYRTAKRKLKLALQEFYRSLELLKSYALLNRTAFRKLNKKYDKAVNARPAYRYMNDKVNKSWFVNSDVLDGHIRTVEDLYARYFERGNHKIAAGKLRNLQKHPGDLSDSTFRSGLLIGLGLVFTVQGLVYGSEMLSMDDDGDSDPGEQTRYVLQLYGGYFLMLLLFGLFTLDCRMWTRHKVNYSFIFEFDSRNALHWKQLAEFPSFFFALFGVFIWLNFSRIGSWGSMYTYYPVLLICITLAVLLCPAPVLYHKARRWFLYSHYRLLLSGLYPVEFRDFFLGDIWCSLTYATCNIELFFCLYAHSWGDPEQCNSSHSRLLGFFNALPPIWRALQCIRRYHDTKNVFPHLVNCGKYTMTILTAVYLSVYRIGDTETNLALYITFATINAVYCSIWDLFMDFSLLQPHSRSTGPPLLREITALRPLALYYVIMILDPILRFAWVFYAIFTHDAQHSTVVSFLVALAEVLRRGMWTLLRVENEHCANVAQYKAARDTPLPYRLPPSREEEEETAAAAAAAAAAAGREEGGGEGGGAGGGRTPEIAVAVFAPSPSPASPLSLGPGAPPRSGSLRVHHMPTPRSEVVAAFATGIDTEAADKALESEEAGGIGTTATFRRRRARTDTASSKRSIRQAMAEAHKQDFEKKRRPLVSASVGGGGGGGGEEGRLGGEGLTGDEKEEDEEGDVLRSEEEDDEDEDEEDDDELQEERMRARETETLRFEDERDK